jgi:2-C-methyl-D-erythritol 4-phosphate cytidylyltransferase
MLFDSRLQKDWATAGPQAFTFEILEELEQTAEQSKEAFMDDLQTLEQLRRPQFDAAQAY